MDNEPYRRANWANITMFQFMSDNELPPPDQKHEEDPEMGTVIFDWNMPGSNAEVSYRKESGTKVSPPTNIQPSNVGNVSYVFEGWYDAPTGGNKIGDTVEVPDNKYVVYYAHWRVETVDPPIPEVGEGDMYVVYFDYNLPGTGVTTAYSTAGRFEWTAKVDGETKTFYVQLQFQFLTILIVTDTHLRAGAQPTMARLSIRKRTSRKRAARILFMPFGFRMIARSHGMQTAAPVAAAAISSMTKSWI